jgi:hypothetical protein
MKRLLLLGVLLAILIGAVGSHGSHGTSTTVATTSEPTPTAVAPAPKPARHHAGNPHYTRCDQNIAVGPATTCGFADNVFRAFASRITTEGSSPANYTVQAASTATGKTYSMSCRTHDATTECFGGKAARVRFPLHAAQVYNQPAPRAPSTPSESSEPEGEETEPEQPAPEEPAPEEPEASEPESSETEPVCTNGTYVNAAGNTVCSPEESPNGPPAGASAECEDGTYSFSESRSGTCSHHGGVSKWLN